MAEVFEVRSAHERALLAGSVCAFGVFDGVHVGHRYLIEAACEQAKRASAPSIALTFDIDPDELFRPDSLKKLLSNERRIELLAASGVDRVAVLPFTRDFAALGPREFLDDTFSGFAPVGMHVGRGFRFGRAASGTEADLESWAGEHAASVSVHDLACSQGQAVSATRIRGLLSQGKIEEANRLLGRPYAMEGEVVSGRGEGADMGIRTANLHVPERLRALGDGVYAAWAEVDGARFRAAVNVGVAATFADRATANVEAHLLDFSGDIYGRRITLDFMNWLRPMKKFDDVAELIATIEGNIAWVRENL